MIKVYMAVLFIISPLFGEVGNFSISSSTHDRGVISNSSSLIMNWEEPTVSNEEELVGYIYAFEKNSSLDLEYIGNFIPSSTNTLSINLEDVTDGTYYFHILAITDRGTTSSMQVYGEILVDSTPPIIEFSSTTLDSGKVQISLSSPTDIESRISIYYTLDGSEPTTTSTLYSAPFEIGSDVTIKYFGIDNANNSSEIKSREITVLYQGYFVYFTNISNGNLIATTSENRADTPISEIYVSGTNLDSYVYRIDSNEYSSWINGDKGVEISSLQDGLHTLYVIGQDSDGNVQSEPSQISFTVDNSPPQFLVGNVEDENISEFSYFSNSISLNFESEENVTIRYTLDGTNPSKSVGTEYLYPIQISESIEVLAVGYDSLGNIGDVQRFQIYIDRESPTGLNIFDSSGFELNASNPAYFETKYIYNSEEQFHFILEDDMEIEPTVYWTVDGTSPTNFSSSGNPLVTKTSTLKFVGIDEVGNRTDIDSRDIVIDKLPPVITDFVITGDCNLRDGIYVCGETNAKIVLVITENITPDDIYINYTTNGEVPSRTSNEANSSSKTIEVPLSGIVKKVKIAVYDWIENRSDTLSLSLKYEVPVVSPLANLSLSDGALINFEIASKIDVSIENGGETPLYFYKFDSNNSFEENSSNSIDISDFDDGEYILSVIASNGEINSSEQNISFEIDNTPPNPPLISGENNFQESSEINITTDDNSTIYFSKVFGVIPATEYTGVITITSSTVIYAETEDEVGNRSGMVKKTFLKYGDTNISILDPNATISDDPNTTEPSDPNTTEPSDPNTTDPEPDDPVIEPDPEPDEPTIDPNYGVGILDQSGFDVVDTDNGEKIIFYDLAGNEMDIITINYKAVSDIVPSNFGDNSRQYVNSDITVRVLPSSDLIIIYNRVSLYSKVAINEIVSFTNSGFFYQSDGLVSNNGNVATLNFSYVGTSIATNYKLNGGDLGFPEIAVSSGSSISMKISTSSNNSLNFEVEAPLSGTITF